MWAPQRPGAPLSEGFGSIPPACPAPTAAPPPSPSLPLGLGLLTFVLRAWAGRPWSPGFWCRPISQTHVAGKLHRHPQSSRFSSDKSEEFEQRRYSLTAGLISQAHSNRALLLLEQTQVCAFSPRVWWRLLRKPQDATARSHSLPAVSPASERSGVLNQEGFTTPQPGDSRDTASRPQAGPAAPLAPAHPQPLLPVTATLHVSAWPGHGAWLFGQTLV